ncbi:major facilitator superfamily domain-containing protein [Phyllosticta citriasiana]|uniref:major facilitator superfamily domain-containing protein n=1 Tax=Phyllosticta citriasiana TaxID=595635 RepID=UPI0030FD4A41
MLSFQALRRRASHTPEKTPFPTRQLFVLACCRIAEPIAFMSIFPYIYYMIISFGITTDEKQIAMYAGMVTSAFAFAEFLTGIMWGHISDRVGRKPILLLGLAGTGLSMLMFGFAKNLPMAMLARALGGLLNGNMGVLQTTVAEVVTVESHQHHAYAIMPFVWCLGSIIGSGLGGTLAEPVKGYPSVFSPGSLFDKFPYLLPNLFCTAIVCFSLIIGILFLEETHEDKKDRNDYGAACGRWILRKLRGHDDDDDDDDVVLAAKAGYIEQTCYLLADESDDDQPPGYQSTEGSPRLNAEAIRTPPRGVTVKTSRFGVDPQIVLNIVGLGVLAFHTISFEQLLPVLMSLPESTQPARLPFKFMGGFGLPAKTIGFILSAQGFLQMIAQIFVFPNVCAKLGPLRTFRLTIMTYPLLYTLTPYLTLMPESMRMSGVLLVLVWKVAAQAMTYPALSIMLANIAPSRKVLGKLNGTAASSASLCRGLGPTVMGSIQSAGLSRGCSGLAWWACALVAIVGAVESSWMRQPRPRFSEKSAAEEVGEYEHDEENALGEPLLNTVSYSSKKADDDDDDDVSGACKERY